MYTPAASREYPLRRRQVAGVVREDVVEVRAPPPPPHLSIFPCVLHRPTCATSLCQPSATGAAFWSSPPADSRETAATSSSGRMYEVRVGSQPRAKELDTTLVHEEAEELEDIESCECTRPFGGRRCSEYAHGLWCDVCRSRGRWGGGYRTRCGRVFAGISSRFASIYGRVLPRSTRTRVNASAYRLLVNLPFMLLVVGTVSLAVYILTLDDESLSTQDIMYNTTATCAPFGDTRTDVWIRGTGVAYAASVRSGDARVVLHVDTARCTSGKALLHVQPVATIDYKDADGLVRTRRIDGDTAYCVQVLLSEQGRVYDGVCTTSA